MERGMTEQPIKPASTEVVTTHTYRIPGEDIIKWLAGKSMLRGKLQHDPLEHAVITGVTKAADSDDVIIVLKITK